MIYVSATNVQGFIYYFGIFYLKIGKFYTFFQLGKGPIMGPKISLGKSLDFVIKSIDHAMISLTLSYSIHRINTEAHTQNVKICITSNLCPKAAFQAFAFRIIAKRKACYHVILYSSL